MIKCLASNCSDPVTDLAPTILYVLDYSQNPPKVHDILVSHKKCRLLNSYLKQLSGVLTRPACQLGFAEVESVPRAMIKFLERFYGKRSNWSKAARDVCSEISDSLKEKKTLQITRAFQHIDEPKHSVMQSLSKTTFHPPPDALKLKNSYVKLSALQADKYNPALLPCNIHGYVKVVIGSHPPIIGAQEASSGQIQNYVNQVMGSNLPIIGAATHPLPPESRPYANLSYMEYEVPERTARGMLRYGQYFIKALATLSTLTNTPHMVMGDTNWHPEKIGNFLYFVLTRPGTDSLRLPLITTPSFAGQAKGRSLSELKQLVVAML